MKNLVILSGAGMSAEWNQYVSRCGRAVGQVSGDAGCQHRGLRERSGVGDQLL